MTSLFIQRLTKALFFLGAFLFLTIIVLTIANITMRFFGSSLRGTVELCGFLGAASIALCLPQLQMQKAHASAGIFFEHLPAKVQSVQIMLVHIVCFALTLAMFLELYDLTIFVHEGMEVVDGWDIPSALFIALLTLGLLAQSLIIAYELAGMVKNILKKFKVNLADTEQGVNS